MSKQLQQVRVKSGCGLTRHGGWLTLHSKRFSLTLGKFTFAGEDGWLGVLLEMCAARTRRT